MRVEGAISSLSWIPSEAVTGAIRAAFDKGPGHYDPPPPDRVGGLDDLRRLSRRDACRFAHRLSGWADVSDGAVVATGFATDSDGVIAGTTLRVGALSYRSANVALPLLRSRSEAEDGSVVLQQTFGGRTSQPLPRLVHGAPFVRVVAPIVWTTLRLIFFPDGSSRGDLEGASRFPRHWVFDRNGALEAKSGLTDFADWMRRSAPERTPWGASDSPVVLSQVESALERRLSAVVMHGGSPPTIRALAAGDVLIEQGDAGTDVYLVLDGLVTVAVHGEVLGELGPGAVVGERAVLEGGRRTATLTASTTVRVAAVDGSAIDRDELRRLVAGHRREEASRS